MDTTAAQPYNRFEMVPNRAWNIFLTAVDAISSIPVERMMFSRRRSSQGGGPSSPTTSAETPESPAVAPTIRQVDLEGNVLPEAEPPPMDHRATSGHPQPLTREGTPPERLGYQEGEIWSNLWLLEGHLKQACQGCGGDLECCAKHGAALVGLARETQSMTTDPRLDQVIAVAREVFPRVQPEDVKVGTYAAEYPALALKVSEVRNRFRPPRQWVMGKREGLPPVSESERQEILTRAKTMAHTEVDALFEKDLGLKKEA